MRVSFCVLMAGLLSSPAASRAAEPAPPTLPKPTAAKKPLKGGTKAVAGLTVTTVKLPKSTLPFLTWADDKGSAFYALDQAGTLRRVTFPALTEEWQLELGKDVDGVARSAEGLVVSRTRLGEYWLLDPDKAEVKRSFRITTGSVRPALTAPKLSVVVVYDAYRPHLLDLKAGTVTKGDEHQLSHLRAS